MCSMGNITNTAQLFLHKLANEEKKVVFHLTDYDPEGINGILKCQYGLTTTGYNSATHFAAPHIVPVKYSAELNAK